MFTIQGSRDLVVAVCPFTTPAPAVVAAAERVGGLGVLDLGLDLARAIEALGQAARWCPATFGVRVPAGCPVRPDDLPGNVDTVILGPGAAWGPAGAGAGRRVLVEVTSVAEATAAARSGAHGLVARGVESGGPVGDLTTFTLLQRLLADRDLDLPVWAAGGIGEHTAAAAVAGGAVGVLLDSQLAGVREVDLPDEVTAAVLAMDGSETVVLAGHRVYVRPDLPVASMTDTDVDAATVSGRLGGRDLRAQFLPVGQDGAFARRFADRYVTTGGVVRAVRDAITAHLREAVDSRPLEPGSRFAAARGLRYPVAQGPMTRVSDRAAFARAVADGGGLPFLACALMSGPELADLLAETADLLGDSPWGVGLLGFVPPALREAQLEVISAVRPPVALIAGGRPAQAAPLEAAGIDTFLHVPSPGLLRRFLADGARKFVVEGRECGGHVGPRASFPLWDAQITTLLEHGDAAGDGFWDDVHMLFAGGVHDERSAAMVAAAAAPLARRGAGVGVLMGTAYLFTGEAVATGAIMPGFQAAALDCESTVLLETSPGHATRCVDSEYVTAFSEAKQRLIAAGVPRQEMWAELEQLNLGRLRIASKGLRRDGDTLVEVDGPGQAREGMFMIGQIAELRSGVTTIAALHDQVTSGATATLAARVTALETAPADSAAGGAEVTAPARPLDIAIVGMAGVFPGAPDLQTYWANIVAGVDAVTEVPSSRWDPAVHFDPAAVVTDAGKRTPSKWGGFLSPVPFDALRYGIPPTSLSSIEPAQLLALEVSARALADAGYETGLGRQDAGAQAGRPFDRGRASVIFGAEAGTDLAAAYGFRSSFTSTFAGMPAELDARLPSMDEDSFPGLLSNVIAGRIANRLDLGGLNFTVDAACASSLAALDAACKELAAGTSDVVLCGGADTHNSIQDYLLFASVHALSPTGRCRSFDADADGISLGEGVAVVVLKRLADAERDGDRIHAVIRSVAGSSDGRALGMTAPRKAGQRLALERAYDRAGISPSEVGLLEAHATGTVVGDRTELTGLTEVFLDHGATPGSCAVGSVKSQIGHTKCAAGLAGLIKAARAVATGVRPPTINMDAPNDCWDASTSPFYFDTQARPWAAPASDRHAGLSAFGFGGTNFHVVLSAYDGGPEPAHGLDAWPAELFVFRGTDRAAAVAAIDRLAALVGTNDDAGRPWRLRDLARTAAAGAGGAATGPVQVAFVAGGLDDLPGLLARARSFEHDAKAGLFVADADHAAGQVGFLFPGQGSQRPGMLADLFVAFPRLRKHLTTGARFAPAMFPPAAFSKADRDRQSAAITDTRVAQPTLGIAGLAVHDLLTSLGVRPDAAAGHSYGELVALAVTGALDERDLLTLSEARADAILTAAGDDPGTMAAVSSTAVQVRPHLVEGVVIANHNAPKQVVISGPTAAVSATLAALADAGISAKRLPVAAAFHSPVVAAGSTAFAGDLAWVPAAAPSVPVWSNTTAAPYDGAADEVRDTLARQIAEPVRFVEMIESMYAAGVRTFVEAGPGRVLRGLTSKILGDRPHRAVAVDVPGENGVRRLLLALAELAAAGVPVDTAPLFAGRDARVVSASAVPRAAGWLVDGHLVRTADGRHLPGGLVPADELERLPVPASAPVLSGPIVPAGPSLPAALPVPAGFSGVAMSAGQPVQIGAADVDATVLEFLRSTRELMLAQRDVVLAYLGVPPDSGSGASRPIPAQPVLDQPAFERPRSPVVIPAQAGSPEPGPRTQAPVPVPAAPSAAAPVLDTAAVMAAVIGAIADQTGYPVAMLEPDLDLEADLSIDSIKRTEILAELGDRIGLGAASGGQVDETVVEELAQVKTVRGIVDWIVARVPDAGAPAHTDGVAQPIAASAPVMDTAAVMAAVIGAIADQTGYPVAMLEPDLDLEADLSIDSIKRTEILAELGDRIGLGAASDGQVDEAVVEELAQVKSVRGIVDWIVDRAGERPAAPVAAEAPGTAREGSGGSGDAPVRVPPQRFVVEPAALAALPALEDVLAAAPAGTTTPVGAPLAGTRFAVVDGGLGIGLALSGLLERHGAEVRVFAGDDPGLTEQIAAGAGADGVVYLPGADPDGTPALPRAFEALRAAALGTRRLLIATGARGAGLPGLGRALARELPDLTVRVVDVDPKDTPDNVATDLLGELFDPSAPVVVAHRGGLRTTPKVVPSALPGPTGRPPLGPGSVVLLTGGARGITGRVAEALAKASGCALELIGRTPLPDGPEDPVTADAADAVSIRRALIGAGVRTPAEIEARMARLLVERELRATMQVLRAVAPSVRYHAVDVRDTVAVRAVVADVYARHGRLDGVVHGAGVLEDKFLRDKTPASFERVWSTKVDGARALVDAVRGDLGFLVLFGSVSGVFGNRGQVDYAAANDALDSYAQTLRDQFAGRVVSVDWGPWASASGTGSGMVSAELEREYARRGMGLIDPDHGAAALIAELHAGIDAGSQVVYMSGSVEAFDA